MMNSSVTSDTSAMNNENGLHVLFLTPGFPKDESDTACVTGIQTYLKALQKARPDILISVVAMQYPRQEKKYQWRRIQIYALGRPDFRTVKKLFSRNQVHRLINKIHAEQPIQILHSFWLGECAMIGQKVERTHGIKHLCTVMGREMLGVNYYARLIRLNSLRLICQSAFQNNMLRKKFQSVNAHIIPFGIDTTDMSPLNRQTRNIDLLFVGNINENKNLEGFLEVASSLIRQFPKLSITIIGDNFLNTPVDVLLTKYRLANNTSYLGKVTHDVVLEHMSRAKILVHTSFFEAGALVFMEALMQGMYIVSREVGLVQQQDRWELAETTEEFVMAVSKFLNTNLQFERHIPYNMNQTVVEYTSLYQRALLS